MDRRISPTKDVEALSSFVQGRALFQAYLGSAHGEELQNACERFATAAARDSEFDIARLYLAVTQTELREPDAAIPNLEELIERKRYVAEAYVQLAYAHIKRYRDIDYVAADRERQNAINAARSAHREDLIDLIQAYRIFLLAVRGGRGTEELAVRKQYLTQAITDGRKLLDRVSARKSASDQDLAIQFEARNALGIAFLWMGELFWSEPNAASAWTEAERYLDSARALRPNSVRALQNMGLLRMLQADRVHDDPVKANALYEEAKQFVGESLSLNSFDQYPHFQMALLLARTGNWTEAKRFLDQGKNQKGAISAKKWDSLENAIDAQDRSAVVTFR